jgi:uncharacterized protein (DUF342 family)
MNNNKFITLAEAKAKEQFYKKLEETIWDRINIKIKTEKEKLKIKKMETEKKIKVTTFNLNEEILQMYFDSKAVGENAGAIRCLELLASRLQNHEWDGSDKFVESTELENTL